MYIESHEPKDQHNNETYIVMYNEYQIRKKYWPNKNETYTARCV